MKKVERLFTKVNILMVKEKEKDNFFLIMAIIILVNLKKT